jgi:hypothetical protein
MSSHHIRNVSLQDCRKFLSKVGCKKTRTSGGHEHWTRADLPRPITIQTHIDPVPERIMKQILTALNLDKEKFWDTLNN